jgi:hypothetical protein
MAANWQNAYGAIGATDALRQILTDRIAAEKVEEENRRAKVIEANAAARLAQEAEQNRLDRAARQGEFVSGRDERYEGALRDVRRQDLMTQERATERDINRKVRIDEGIDRAAEREAARAARVEDREDQQDFLRRQASQAQAAARELNAPARELMDEERRLRIEAARDKLTAGRAATAKTASDADTSTRAALDSVRALLRPKGIGRGLDAATGAYELRGFTQDAQDWKAERDRLVAMLTLPNLGALKGPMSDKDILFVKQLSSTLQNENVSGDFARKELAKLQRLLETRIAEAEAGDAAVMGRSGGGLVAPPMGRSGGPGGGVPGGAPVQEFDYVNGQLVPRGGG